jgi:hypothetical protein
MFIPSTLTQVLLLMVALKSTHGKNIFPSGTSHEASVTVSGDVGDNLVSHESLSNHRRSARKLLEMAQPANAVNLQRRWMNWLLCFTSRNYFAPDEVRNSR